MASSFLGIIVLLYLVYWPLFRISLGNSVGVFFVLVFVFSLFFLLDIVVLVDYFQAVGMFLIFLIEFFSPQFA